MKNVDSIKRYRVIGRTFFPYTTGPRDLSGERTEDCPPAGARRLGQLASPDVHHSETSPLTEDPKEGMREREKETANTTNSSRGRISGAQYPRMPRWNYNRGKNLL